MCTIFLWLRCPQRPIHVSWTPLVTKMSNHDAPYHGTTRYSPERRPPIIFDIFINEKPSRLSNSIFLLSLSTFDVRKSFLETQIGKTVYKLFATYFLTKTFKFFFEDNYLRKSLVRKVHELQHSTDQLTIHRIMFIIAEKKIL